MMDADVERRMLGLIGLGIRARNAVVGVEQVRVAARRGRLALAVVARDASPHSRDKVVPLLEARGIRVLDGPTTAALGAATGRDATAAIGILDAALARGLRALVAPRAVGGARRVGRSRAAVRRASERRNRTSSVVSRPSDLMGDSV